MCDTDQRLMIANKCAPPSHSMVVNQVIGESSEQEAFDIHVCIPWKKPSAEQIINVFVKKLRITQVHLITDKVIVRGNFELKAIYVGCKPCQPVHAVEIRNIRFTVDLPICGARCGMEADASVIVEYIDYDDGCDHKCRDDRYKNKYGNTKCQHIKCGHDHDECHQDHGKYHHDCDKCGHDHNKYHHDHDKCGHDHNKDHHHHQSCCCPPHKIRCTREFDVSVVLRVNAKVMVGRKIMINSIFPKEAVHTTMHSFPKMFAYPKMPAHPKG